MKKRKRNVLYQNASLVTGLNIAERTLGFLYRVVLSRFIGAEGVGIYQVALSHFFLLHTVGAGGIPTSVSRFLTRCIAEGKESEKGKTVGAGLSLSLIFTLPLCIVFLFFGQYFNFLFSDERVFVLVRILLFVLPFSCLFEVIRASFWGEKQFFIPALLETAEEIVTVLLGAALLLLSIKNADYTPFDGAKIATIALTVAYFFSFVCGGVCFFGTKRKIGNPTTYLKPLFSAATPITAVRMGSALINSAVAVLFPALLTAAGYTQPQAMQAYGALTGMALPVLSIPLTLISGLALVLMPELSNDFYQKNYPRLLQNITRGLSAAFFLACGLIPFYFAFGADMGGLIYANPLAGALISNGCLLLLPMSLSMISTSILNSLGKEKYTFVFYVLGSIGMLLLLFLLTPLCHEYAYLIALFFHFSLTAVCNLVLLKKTLSTLSDDARRPVITNKVFFTLLGVMVICLLGKTCMCALSGVFSVVIALLLSALVITCACGGWYLLFLYVPRKTMSKKEKKNCIIL